MVYESYDIKFNQGTSKVHRFYTKKGNTPIFFIHGYFEDGRIFFTKKGKGLASYLAENGFDVFVCDLLGKGESI
jgi:pimeloyl-ACP methyl ester carboxylesterase